LEEEKLMKKVLVISTLLSFLPLVVLAQPNMGQGLNEFLNETGLSNADLVVVIGRIVKIVISFLGLIAVVIIIIGGFKWMTSGGNEETIKKAKKLMINGIIGLVIIVLAYAIASFIISAISGIVQG
jgi:ketopantoate hydroxymethyltransferase